MPKYLRLLLLAGFLFACSSQPTPAPTAPPVVSAATVTSPAPTVAPAPSNTAVSAVTSTSPAAASTATTAPSQTVAATTAASITPTPQVVNPLTGLPLSDPTVLDRRPLAIKIANFPRRVRAAQTGLSQADNVWEHYAEGGTTRFTAIFLSQGPDRIGNVRSARLIDTYLGQAYQAMLVASGSSTGTLDRLKKTDFFNRVIAEYTGYGGCPVLCREVPENQTSDKLFTSAPAVWDLAAQKGLDGQQDLSGFTFDAQAPAGGTPISTAHIDWQLNNTVAEWRYDAAAQVYDRWIDTETMPTLTQHIDTLNSQPLTAANVVIIYANYVTSNIHESDSGDKLYFSYDIQLYGTGPAKLFRDGQMYDLTWARDPVKGGLPRLTDASGSVIAFRPGNIWFEAVSTMSVNMPGADLFTVRVHVPDPTIAATQQPTPGK